MPQPPLWTCNITLKYAELQSQRDKMIRLREENRSLVSRFEELQLRYEDETIAGATWKKEKDRFEAKIADTTKALEASNAAQSEQQTQIVSLHSQVRELRSVLNEADTDRTLLKKARQALQAELESIKVSSDSADIHKAHTVDLQKQDLERALDEQQDRVQLAFERMKKAEAHANECQVELSRLRVDNSELDSSNVRVSLNKVYCSTH